MNKKDIIEDYNVALTRLALFESVSREGREILSALSEYDRYKAKKKPSLSCFLSHLAERLSAFFKRTYILLPKLCTVLFLVLILSSCFILSSASAMEKLGEILINKSKATVEMQYSDNRNVGVFQANKFYLPSYAPTGFYYDSVRIDDSSVDIHYFGLSSEGAVLEYRYEYYPHSFSSSFDNEHDTIETIVYEGTATIYCYERSNNFNTIVAHGESGIVCIDGEIAIEEMLEVYYSSRQCSIINLPENSGK